MAITTSTDPGGFSGKDFAGLEIEWNGEELTREVSDKVGNVFFRTAKNIASGARARAGRWSKTGAYRDSIRAEQASGQGSNLTLTPRAAMVVSGQASPRRVGSFHEKGTGRTPPQPSILPAYDAERDNMERDLTDII